MVWPGLHGILGEEGKKPSQNGLMGTKISAREDFTRLRGAH